MCRWKVNGTTTNHPLLGASRKNSQCTLRLMTRTIREKRVVTWIESHNDLKARGKRLTKRTISKKLHHNHLHYYISCRTALLKTKPKKCTSKCIDQPWPQCYKKLMIPYSRDLTAPWCQPNGVNFFMSKFFSIYRFHFLCLSFLYL